MHCHCTISTPSNVRPRRHYYGEHFLVVLVSLASSIMHCHCFISIPSIVPRSRHYYSVGLPGNCNGWDVAMSSPTLILAAPDGFEWFVKTETFAKPYPEVKPHLEEHRMWVRSLRAQTIGEKNIVSGYRVDALDRPGGGGLMIFAAKDFAAADQFIRNNDPLILNDCVDWELHKWIPETGDISLE